MRFIKQEPLSLAPGIGPGSDRESGPEYSSISVPWTMHDVQKNLQLLGLDNEDQLPPEGRQAGQGLLEWLGSSGSVCFCVR